MTRTCFVGPDGADEDLRPAATSSSTGPLATPQDPA